MSNPNVTIDRHKFIGGSDLPTILGLNTKYGVSIFDFAREKAGIIPNPFAGNQYTRYGQVLEPTIRDYINATLGTHYLEDTVIDEARHLRGNTDGIDRDAEIPIIEIKTFGEELDVAYYTAQCQFYMETFDVDAVLLVGYKRPTDFYTGMDYNLENEDTFFNFEFDESRIVKHVIKRDKQLWEQIYKRITAFQSAVAELKKNKEMTEEQFNSIFFGNELIALTNKVAVLEHTLADFKNIDKEYKELKEKLYNVFEEKGIISFDTGAVKITKVAPTSYETISIDSKKLQDEQPTIYEKYKTIKTTNRKGYILINVKESGKND